MYLFLFQEPLTNPLQHQLQLHAEVPTASVPPRHATLPQPEPVPALAYAGVEPTLQLVTRDRNRLALTAGVAASYGFDAITVALLGRSKPWGTFFAGLLYGGFRAGGVTMQSMTGTNIDIVLVVQSLIVLFIAAPPLVRAIFRLPKVATA